MTSDPTVPDNFIVTSDVQAALDALGLSDLKVGEWFIDTHHHLCQITGFRLHTETNKRDGTVTTLRVEYTERYGGGAQHESSTEAETFQSFYRRDYRHYRLHGSPEEMTREAFESLEHPQEDDDEKPSETVAITSASNSERMKVVARELDEKASRAMVLRLLVERKLYALQHKFDGLMKQLDYTRRVIALLETYLGVYEKIVTIREGEKAPVDTPIVIRQLILHMDEEVGSIDVQRSGQIGIDFKNIDKFDEWLLSDQKHVDAIVPEQKCVVALRPSRQERKYSNNPFDDTNSNNHYVYLLIRNGEHLSRVWANMKMSGYDRLFPKSETMVVLIEALAQEDLSEDDELKLRGKQLDWQQNAVLLEGLLDRTEVFHPLPQRVSLFDHESYASGRLVLIRDAEGGLSDGHLPYADWKESINAKIERGSRILYSGREWGGSSWDKEAWRYDFLNWTWRSPPRYPDAGIRVIDDVIRRNEREVEVNDYDSDGFPRGKQIGSHKEIRFDEYLKFLYLPDDTVYVPDPVYYGVMPKEREKRIAFYVQRRDDNVLNYDLIDLETVEFYINHRLERRNYQGVLPVLYKIRQMRLAEKEYEKPFVRLIASELDCDEALVWKAIDWWKYKVISHRAIADEEDKAWRMIRGRVKRMMKGEIDD